MDKTSFEKNFSKERMAKYFAWHPNDEAKAIRHYQANILVSEAFYPLLTVFEVALRNSLNREMTTFFGTDEWYKNISSAPGLSDLNHAITNAVKLIAKRGEAITAPKVIAELMLGFWVRLLNVEYEMILWKPLRRAFPFMPKASRQRHNVAAPLNKIRDFRNRVFHHEPVCWKWEKLETLHAELYAVIGWINKDLPAFVQPLDRVTEVLNKLKGDI